MLFVEKFTVSSYAKTSTVTSAAKYNLPPNCEENSLCYLNLCYVNTTNHKLKTKKLFFVESAGFGVKGILLSIHIILVQLRIVGIPLEFCNNKADVEDQRSKTLQIKILRYT